MTRIKKIFDVIKILFYLFTAMLCLYAFLAFVLGPLAPIATTLTIGVFTLRSWNSLENTLLSMNGIILYIVAWPASNSMGPWAGVFLSLSGVTIWFIAIYKSCKGGLWKKGET